MTHVGCTEQDGAARACAVSRFHEHRQRGTRVDDGSRREHPSVAPSKPGRRTSSVRSDP